MSQDPRDTSVDDELISRVAEAAPEVDSLTQTQRDALWLAVLAGTDVESSAAQIPGLPAQAQAEQVAMKPAAQFTSGDLPNSPAHSAFEPLAHAAPNSSSALVALTGSVTHRTASRRLFPSGALGRSVLALAACSAAVVIVVNVAHSDRATTQAELGSPGQAQQSREQSAQTHTSDPAQVDSAAVESSAVGLTADSKKRVVAPDTTVASRLTAGICEPASPLVTGCLYDTSYNAQVPLTIPAEGDAPLPTVSVAEPRLDSVNSDSFDFATDEPQWTVTAWFANPSPHAISFDQVPSLVLLPPTAVSLDEQCSAMSQEWTVGGETVPEVSGLSSGENAYLTVTAVCAAGTAAQVPDTRVQWGAGSDLAAIFFKP